ncbi:hypothetical protein [Serratia plymuthica]|nr:hypothetical protein [Serratia plymuthica]
MAFKARMDSADRKELSEILSHNYELVKDILGYSPYVSTCTGPVWEANKSSIKQCLSGLTANNMVTTLMEIKGNDAKRALWTLIEMELRKEISLKLPDGLMKSILNGVGYKDLVAFLTVHNPVERERLLRLLPAGLVSVVVLHDFNYKVILNHLKENHIENKINNFILAKVMAKSSVTWGVFLNTAPIVYLIVS